MAENRDLGSTRSQEPTNSNSGTKLDRYELLERIGEGGMGEVWVARQSAPVKRKVALKLIKKGMDSKQVIARFELERQALAVMDHPNIAKVLDGGLTETGQPFFVMELVAGRPLVKFCDEAKLGIRERLELFVPICQAVQHAHQKGIVHRDLKPANILVTLVDGKPIPRIIDFGVAKALSGKLTDEPLSTHFGAIVGTIEYMAPEQAGLTIDDVDTRADIYSLGVILFELLTGLRPFNPKRLRRIARDEILRIIREEEPPSLASRLSTDESLASAAAMRRIEPRRLLSLVKGELDWIVQRCLEKDRNRRYETANGLGRDVQRYLADEPVEARPVSTWYRLRKLFRRNRGPVAAVGLVVLTLLGGIVASWRQANRATRAEVVAEDRRKEAENAEETTLADYRASTDDAIEQLIGSKPELGLKEKTYLENTLKRWQSYAKRQGDDQRSRAIRGEGHARVGHLWAKLTRNDEARAEYESAISIQEKLAADFPAVHEYRQNLASSHNNLGILLTGLGKRPEAENQYRKAMAIQEKLVAEFPALPAYQQDLARSHYLLGHLAASLGKRSEAEEQYEKGLAIRAKLAADFPDSPEYRQELASSHTIYGQLLAGLGKRSEAKEQYRKALTIQERLAADYSALAQYQMIPANTHTSLGLLLTDLDKKPEAEEQFQKALAAQGKLAADFPAVSVYRQNLALTRNNLGRLLAAQGKWRQADEQYGKALTIQEKLAADFPTMPDYRHALAVSYNNLGLMLAGLGKRSEAQQQYRRALAIRENLVADFPAVPLYQVELGNSYKSYAHSIQEGGNPAESLPWYDRAIAHLQPVLEKEPRDVTVKRYLRNTHVGRGEARHLLERNVEAVKDWDRAIELSPPHEQLELRASRATSRLHGGMFDEAEAEFAELTKSSNWNAVQWYDFACVYAVASGKFAAKKKSLADRAMELLNRAVEAGYKDVAHIKKDPDFDSLRPREDLKKLVADLEAKSPPAKKSTTPTAVRK